MKAKQEMPFPILKKSTRGEKIALALLAYLYELSWCFDLKLLNSKLLTRLQTMYILIYLRSLQSKPPHYGEFYTTKGQNCSIEN